LPLRTGSRSDQGGIAIEPVTETKRSIAVRISVLARMLRSNFDRQVADLNVTRSQWQMIAVVAARPGATQRSIAEILEMSEASAGRLIDRLCAEGLLTRRERDDDRRARAIYLTEAAEPLLGKLAEIGKTSETVLFKGFSETEVGQLEDYLGRMYANVGRQ
jgi:MarR family transcriptional regulator, transcriptional regulator for hemolysin